MRLGAWSHPVHVRTGRALLHFQDTAEESAAIFGFMAIGLSGGGHILYCEDESRDRRLGTGWRRQSARLSDR